MTLPWVLACLAVAALCGCMGGYFLRGFTDAAKKMKEMEDSWGDYPAPQTSWEKITEDRIIPAINAAGDRNVRINVNACDHRKVWRKEAADEQR